MSPASVPGRCDREPLAPCRRLGSVDPRAPAGDPRANDGAGGEAGRGTPRHPCRGRGGPGPGCQRGAQPRARREHLHHHRTRHRPDRAGREHALQPGARPRAGRLLRYLRRDPSPQRGPVLLLLHQRHAAARRHQRLQPGHRHALRQKRHRGDRRAARLLRRGQLRRRRHHHQDRRGAQRRRGQLLRRQQRHAAPELLLWRHVARHRFLHHRQLRSRRPRAGEPDAGHPRDPRPDRPVPRHGLPLASVRRRRPAELRLQRRGQQLRDPEHARAGSRLRLQRHDRPAHRGRLHQPQRAPERADLLRLHRLPAKLRRLVVPGLAGQPRQHGEIQPRRQRRPALQRRGRVGRRIPFQQRRAGRLHLAGGQRPYGAVRHDRGDAAGRHAQPDAGLPVDDDGAPTGSLESFTDDHSIRAYDYGLYIQDEWKINDQLTLNVGLRFEQVKGYTDESQFSPRISLVWQPDKATALHIGYARYFDPPQLLNISAAAT
ncbi:MAG: TonB-dependent receptor [Verrucomicrobiota bacterium]